MSYAMTINKISLGSIVCGNTTLLWGGVVVRVVSRSDVFCIVDLYVNERGFINGVYLSKSTLWLDETIDVD